MYIVENRVFFTCGRIEQIDEQIILKNVDKFNKVFEDIELEMKGYWFNRFNNTDNEYIKIILKKNENWYDFDVDDNFKDIYEIEKFTIKIHKNGISSTEVFFKLRNDNSKKFDEDIDDFSNRNTEKLFNLVFQFNEILAELGILKLSNTYKYGALINDPNINILKFFSNVTFGEKRNDDKNLTKMQGAYLMRVHRLVSNENSYTSIHEKYKISNTKHVGSDIEINNHVFKGTLFWAFALWYSKIEPNLLIEKFSDLLDIDTYTMNEIVIYNTAGDTYTDLMYEINLDSTSQIKSTDLFEMYKVNGYFLQKNKLAELSFSENVNNFVTCQREIEKFKMQQETFLEAEKKFHDVYNAVEANEKTTANRIVQFVLTALTLLTIISVSKDILEFIKAEFQNEHVTKIDLLSRSEVLVGLLIFIIVLFVVLRKNIKKV